MVAETPNIEYVRTYDVSDRNIALSAERGVQAYYQFGGTCPECNDGQTDHQR